MSDKRPDHTPAPADPTASPPAAGTTSNPTGETRMVCTVCGEEAHVEAMEIPEGASRLLAFACGNCGTEYPFARLSARGVQLRKRLSDHRTRRAQRAADARRSGAEPYKGQPAAVEDERQEQNLLRAYRRELKRLDPEKHKRVIGRKEGR